MLNIHLIIHAMKKYNIYFPLKFYFTYLQSIYRIVYNFIEKIAAYFLTSNYNITSKV